MAVKVVVELKTKPGKRDELKCLFETLIAEIGPSLKEEGSLGSTLYEMSLSTRCPRVAVPARDCSSGWACSTRRDRALHVGLPAVPVRLSA